MLFGFGFALQMLRVESSGRAFAPLYVRRLLALLGFGIAHGVLLWAGDILSTYAVLGFLLLAFRRARPRTLLFWAAGLIAALLLLSAAMVGGLELLSGIPEVAKDLDKSFDSYRAQASAQLERAYADYRSGFVQALARRSRDFASMAAAGLVAAPPILAMFLIGLYAAKTRLPERPEALRRVALAALPVGVLANALYVAAYARIDDVIEPSWWSMAAQVGVLVGGPALAFSYAGLWLSIGRKPIFRPLAAAGRMALTNYLLQSVIGGLVFNGYGLGLMGRVGTAGCVGLVFAVFAAQLAFSVLKALALSAGSGRAAVAAPDVRLGRTSHSVVEGAAGGAGGDAGTGAPSRLSFTTCAVTVT